MKSIDPPARIAVIGAGTMGNGIAQVCASAGFEVIMFDVRIDLVEKGLASIRQSLDKLVMKGKLTPADASAIASRVLGEVTLEHVTAELIVEAVVENISVKREIFSRLEAVNSAESIFVSNTSSLSINEIGNELQHPERFAGLHFFNPAPLMKLVEIVAGSRTAAKTIEILRKFCARLEKQAVLANDSPGFIVNRVARPFYTEALYLLEQSACDESGIDRLLRNSGFRMGPFELMDLIGIDVNLAVTKSIYYASGKPERFTPSRIQQQKADNGELGRKTGKGFYEYHQKN